MLAHAAFIEIVRAVRSEHDRAMPAGPHQQPADVRMLPKRGNEPGMTLFDLLERQPAMLGIHQIHEPEVAQAEDHHLAVRHIVLWPFLLLGVGTAGRLGDR